MVRKFKYEQQVRRIGDKRVVPSLFDNPPKISDGRTATWTGQIASIDAIMHYDEHCKYTVSTQQEDDLPKVYRTLLERLIDINDPIPPESISPLSSAFRESL